MQIQGFGLILGGEIGVQSGQNWNLLAEMTKNGSIPTIDDMERNLILTTLSKKDVS